MNRCGIATIVIATKNHNKLRELKRYLRGVKAEVLSLESFPGAPHVVENGRTFRSNAAKKAIAISRFTDSLALADDSGLSVRALGGAPGVRSARFAGGAKDDAANNSKLLRLLKDTPASKRQARFVCAVAIADRGRLIKTLEKSCAGKVAFEPAGRYGFGYDPLFIVPGYCGKTFGELGLKVKDALSHRAKALRAARVFLRSHL
jgi:XTP/dITP diphosphohydrolase